MEPVLKLCGNLNGGVCQTSALCSEFVSFPVSEGSFQTPSCSRTPPTQLPRRRPSFLSARCSVVLKQTCCAWGFAEARGLAALLARSKVAPYKWEGGLSEELIWRNGPRLVLSWLSGELAACFFSSRTNLGIIEHSELDCCKLPMEVREQESIAGLKGEGEGT